MGRLTSNVAVMTGGESGIGLATARLFVLSRSIMADARAH